MAKFKNFKKKVKLRTIISVVLVIAAVIGLGAGISAIARDETKTISSVGTFIRGSINAKGEYEPGNDSIVTEDVFSCYGLTITPDFDCRSSYQIFWYNMDKLAMGSTAVMNTVYAQDIPECAKYCRVVITPEKESKDDEISFWDVSSIASKIKIEVNKDQSVLPIDYFKAAQAKTAPEGHQPTNINERYQFYKDTCYWAENETFAENMNYVKDSNAYAIKLDCSKVASYKVFFEEDACENFGYGLLDAQGNVVGYGYYFGGTPGREIIIDLAKSWFEEGSNLSNAKYIVFGISECEIPPVINTYMPR